MREILNRDCVLILDDEGMIRHQYRQKLPQGTYGHEWVRQMATRDKIREVSRARIDRGTVTQVKEAHLDDEDYKYYVRTAAASESKALVSHDPDYSSQICRILKRRLGISVYLPREGRDYVVDP